MRFMMILKADKKSEAGIPPNEKLLADIQGVTMAGVSLVGEALHGSLKGARLKFSGQKRHVIDGPFAETKEMIAASAFQRDRDRDAADLRDRGFRFGRYLWRSQEEGGEVAQRLRAA